MAMTLSVKEAAAELGVCIPSVYSYLIPRQDFPAFRVGNRWLIPKDGLRDWIEKQGQEKEEIDLPRND